ncbi:LysR family transcriptional regulator [Saccharopolyspora sp. NFXS83]|uniref:LysR family transcriptional regulator n=1 Tax=Saccharopolyspora sp. NFXS83 TaxID=2993560 RepID=UPI00224A65FB|nr:LysR family transcriptional regulator [Saccharopolyspora sp. NFXS83]MCX2730173.1 LysR family transcriptional regulator [Saccharopolyspora sp. NFXS83]
MDLVGGCRAFVSVSEAGSFTGGSAAAGIPQPVASRRIAALERHLGERLFDRSARRARLTPFGRDLLPRARRLVRLADALEQDAKRARLRPLRLAVPATCPTRALAELDAEARSHELFLEFRPAAPAERLDFAHTHDVRAALTAVPADEAVWTVPLGVASAVDLDRAAVHLDSLRIGRTGRAPRRRVWIQPEDDVPHVRDRLLRVRDAVGLRPTQVVVAESLSAGVADVLGSADLLLCSRAQAAEFALHWHPIAELPLARGYDVTAEAGPDADRLRTALWRGIARCLGADA